MIKVGLIRGAYLSPFEMQTYERMIPAVDLEAYRIRINRFPTDIIKVPIRRLRCIDDPAAMLSPKLGFYFDLLLQATCGLDYYHFGLVDALADKDIAHTMETFNAFSYQALQAKRRYATRLVVTVWENRPYAAERFTAKRRMKYEVIAGTDLFFAMTPRAARCLELEGADSEKIVVQPPGIDLDRFRPGPKPVHWLDRLGIPHDAFVFLSVAALIWEKGVYEILHAFKRLTLAHCSDRPLRLIFAGSGAERDRLAALAARIGLREQVIFTRFPYDRIHEGYALADVFLLNSAPRPGWLEQFGYALAEALAAGLPVITTQSGSIPEVVGDAALLVPPADFIAVHQAMEDLLGDGARRRDLAVRARLRAEEAFDRDRNAERIREAYERIL
jgi:alpha-maltose-1-phosphate synthase